MEPDTAERPGVTKREATALILVSIVAFFVVASMVVIILFAFQGVPSGENVWAGLFSIVTAILGGVTGYLGGQAVGRRPAPPKEF